MKKLLLTLGSAAAVAAPLATVVACGEDKKETPVVENPGGDTDGGGEESFDENLQIDGKDFIPTEDGVYLMADHYQGTLYDAGAEYTGEILEINAQDYVSPATIHFGKGDSVIVVYDEDSDDGYTLENFEDTFGFLDTNFIKSPKLAEYNAATYGNKIHFNDSWGTDDYSIISTFADGNLNKYVGSSYKTGVSTEASLQSLKGSISDDDYKALLDGLYFVEEEDGSYTDADDFDPNGDHSYVRGQAVNPVPTPLFEYEQIAINAMKITYIQENDAFKQDYAAFGFISEHATKDDAYTIADPKGVLYIGEDTWGKDPLKANWQGSRTV